MKLWLSSNLLCRPSARKCNYPVWLVAGLLTFCLFFSCRTQRTKEEVIKEIRDTEAAFNEVLLKQGVPYAFSRFADSLAVIKRGLNDTLLKGRSAILTYYSDPFYKNAKAYWKPDHIEVSGSLDMAYSYGHYTWLVTDSTGKESSYKGVYLTVWKRQPDNTWRYVWD
ncbi:MAG TPA: hypothetical protein VFR58_08800 [Flavisolibacter sp.]|nr:hypothetical protein [Flavisolibacter sp.]